MPNATLDTKKEEEPKLQLSLVQVTAAVLASITSAVILSKFGVAGTYLGTAIGSAVSTIGVAIYAHTMRQARRRVGRYAEVHHLNPTHAPPQARTVTEAPPIRVPPGAWSARHPRAAPPVRAPSKPQSPGWRVPLDRLEKWFAGLPFSGKVVVTAVTAFVLAVVAVVLFQFLSGHSLTNVWGIGRSSDGPNVGCVVGSCTGAAPASLPSSAPTPVTTTQPTIGPTPAATPAPSSTPLPTPSTAPTVVASPAVGPSPGAGQSGSGSTSSP